MTPVCSIDLETECAVESCAGFGGSHKCDHALVPFTSKVSIFAMVSRTERHAFTNLRDAEMHFHSLSYEEDYDYIGHGFIFDLKQLALHSPYLYNKISSRWLSDTMFEAHVHHNKVTPDFLEAYEAERVTLNADRAETPHRKAKGYSLKTLAPFFLGVPRFWEPVHHTNPEYALTDAEYTLDLHEFFQREMTEEEKKFVNNRPMKWVKDVLLPAELRGVFMDQAALDTMTKDLSAKESELHAKLNEMWVDGHEAFVNEKREQLRNKYEQMSLKAKNGVPLLESPRYMKLYEAALTKLPKGFDYDSPTQMLWFFSEYKDLDAINFQGKESTGKAVLESLTNQGNADIGDFLVWRKTQKMLTSFLPQYKELSSYTGALHPSFHVASTRTGRLSCSNPNVQQVSKKLKKLFIARPGYKFIGYDLSAIEARLIAWYAEDPVLFEIINKGWSIHDYNAKTFFNLDCDVTEVKTLYPKERAAAKRVGFSLFYGAGAPRIEDAFLQEGFVLPDGMPSQMHANFKKAFPASFRFHKDITRLFERGETVLNALGRPIVVQPWENAYMKGFNRLVQSGASDINIHSFYKTLQRVPKGQAFPLLLVHDFVLLECLEENAEQIDKTLVETFSEYKLTNSLGTIPITLEGGISDCWE